MTDILKLAKQVGMGGMLTDVVCTTDELQSFADLIRADYRAELIGASLEPVAWQWLDTANFRKHLPSDAHRPDWRGLFTDESLAARVAQAQAENIADECAAAIRVSGGKEQA